MYPVIFQTAIIRLLKRGVSLFHSIFIVLFEKINRDYAHNHSKKSIYPGPDEKPHNKKKLCLARVSL